MARRSRVSRRRGGKVDAGAAWISYSDMMAALLLVFVLVLCYSLYQYFIMLETKSSELDQQAALLATQSTQLDRQTEQMEQQKAQLDEQQATLQSQQLQLEEKQAELATKQDELTGALTAIDEQKGLLDSQNMTLEEQEKIILAAQVALQQKEEALALAQRDITQKQSELDAATQLLSSQQQQMSTQQQRLEDLVGVRTQIIQELSAGLAAANLRATVDQNTGDIMLESAVFFDVAKDAIKESGQALLNDFIPIYLSVLLQPEYIDFLGEIIIEGHTDTSGTYLSNLELSQKRALSVATYCLKMDSLTEMQQETLRSILTAKGRSFSSPVYAANGTIDMDASRRVEFKFRLKDSEMIDEMRGILSEQ